MEAVEVDSYLKKKKKIAQDNHFSVFINKNDYI